jgi:hypothetical protein
MTSRAWRPLGFLILMVGFGLRLDSDWQLVAWVVLAAGAVAVGLGGMDSRAAFVPSQSGR